MAKDFQSIGNYSPRSYLENEWNKAFSRQLTKTHVQFGAMNLRGRSLKMAVVHTGGIIPSWIFLICNFGEQFFGLCKAVFTDPNMQTDDSISRAFERWKDNCVVHLKRTGDGLAIAVFYPIPRVAVIVKDVLSAVVTPEIAWKNNALF